MKSSFVPVLLACLALSPAWAEDKPLKLDKETIDKGKDFLEKNLDKLVGEAKNAANKLEDSGKELWARTKENLRLSREDYLKKVTSALKTMEAEIAVLAESESPVLSRDYFKTRLEGLKQQLDYCKRDLARLQATDSEETFRVKQKGFDRGLGFLGDNIEMAQEEAGL